jgi:hypothetical protein
VTVPATNAVYYDTTDDVNLGREPIPTEETTPDPATYPTGIPDAPTASEEDTPEDPPEEATEDGVSEGYPHLALLQQNQPFTLVG